MNETHRSVRIQVLAVAGHDSRGFLAAVLERMQPQVGHVGGLGMSEDAEHSTRIMEAVRLLVETLRKITRGRILHDQASFETWHRWRVPLAGVGSGGRERRVVARLQGSARKACARARMERATVGRVCVGRGFR